MVDAILTILVLSVFGVLYSIREWPDWYRWVRAKNWPSADGTVETGEVSTHRSRSGVETATATLGYSYRIHGDYYSGYHTEVFNDEQKAWSYVDQLRRQTIPVRYDPKNPEISVLRQ